MKKFLMVEGLLEATLEKLAKWEEEGVTGRVELSYRVQEGHIEHGEVYFSKKVKPNRKWKGPQF